MGAKFRSIKRTLSQEECKPEGEHVLMITREEVW